MQNKSISFLLLIGVLILTGCMSGLNFRDGIASFKRQDYRQAFVRLVPEAEKGNPDAQYAVGYMYYYGQGVVENRKKAYLWIKRAAASGQTDAIKALSLVQTSAQKSP